MEIYSTAVDFRDHESLSLPEDTFSRKKPRDGCRCYGGDIAGRDKLKYTKQNHSQADFATTSDSYSHQKDSVTKERKKS